MIPKNEGIRNKIRVSRYSDKVVKMEINDYQSVNYPLYNEFDFNFWDIDLIGSYPGLHGLIRNSINTTEQKVALT